MHRRFPEHQPGWMEDLFAGLGGPERDALLAASRSFALEPGQRLPAVREAGVRVEAGLLRLAVSAPDRAVTLSLFGPGDCLLTPLFQAWDSDLYFIEAQEQSRGWVIPEAALLEAAAASPSFSRDLLRQACWGGWHWMHALHTHVFHNLPQRIAQVLLDLTTQFGFRTPKGVTPGLRMTQQELAEMVGARRETLSSILQDLRDEGIVDLRYARIDILDMDGLRHLAGAGPLPFVSRMLTPIPDRKPNEEPA